MKYIFVLIMLLVLCGITEANPIDDAEHYTILVLIWNNETGELDEGIPVTFAGTHTLYTEADGSVVYDIANIDGIEHGATVAVSCKYGLKNAPIIYSTDGVRNWGATVTFNEPDESAVVEMLAAMGIVAISIGGGIYLLRRKTNTEVDNTNTDIIEDDTMTENTEGWKLKQDFGVRALIATLSMTGYVFVMGISAYRGDVSMIADTSKAFMPIMLLIVGFYYSASMVRDSAAK